MQEYVLLYILQDVLKKKRERFGYPAFLILFTDALYLYSIYSYNMGLYKWLIKLKFYILNLFKDGTKKKNVTKDIE